MLWKILSGIAAAFLVVGVVFSYFNQGALREEKSRDVAAQNNLSEAKAEIKKHVEIKDRKTKDLADMEKQRDDAKGAVAKAGEDIVTKQKEVDTLKKNLEDITKQVAQIEDQITKAGDIPTLVAQVARLQKELKDSEAAIANQEQQKAIAEKELVVVQGEITHLKAAEKRQQAGIVDPSFTARVSEAYPAYGFVVLNKGNVGGIFSRAALDVKRGKDVVARLTVREVEQGMSVADLVPGSLASGQTIRSGDLVVPSSIQPKLQEEKAVEKAAGPATAPNAATPPAGMAAPAVPGGDIFGGAASAPATGAMAPAGGIEPAAPAAGAGTPASPRTDDAFGVAPAKPAGTDPFAPK